MAERKRKLFWALIVGTGLNDKILISAHEIMPYPASTYHKFTYPNGATQLKNDFGVSSITLYPVEMTDEELDQHQNRA